MTSPLLMPLPFHLALAGPTASGKTAAALAIAQALAPQHAVEIISVDSALVYRGMDIGTAKPSAAELAQVPHHLIDIRDPLHAYSAAEFARDATALLHAIHARGNLPLLVGGTMLYFKALFDGLDDLPPANPALRTALEDEARATGWPALHQQLALVDPATAARLHPQDAQRISRALEVYRATGQPMSHFHTIKNVANYVDFTRANALFSLEPTDRGWLHTRIAQRLDAMWAAGFVDEVAALRARGDLHPDLPAMRCVGYRQTWETLDGSAPLATLKDRALFATRQLAKRQITWLRGMPERQVVACDAPDAMAQLLARVHTTVQNWQAGLA
jgi:tRNA dimethylallyltransferase